jgi:hypothetical protein
MLELPRRTLSSGLSPVFHSVGTLQTPLRTMLAPSNSELPRGDGWVTSGLRAVFHKGKVVVRGREGMAYAVIPLNHSIPADSSFVLSNTDCPVAGDNPKPMVQS